MKQDLLTGSSIKIQGKFTHISGRCAVKTRSDLNFRVPLAIALGVIVKRDLRTLRMQAISG